MPIFVLEDPMWGKNIKFFTPRSALQWANDDPKSFKNGIVRLNKDVQRYRDNGYEMGYKDGFRIALEYVEFSIYGMLSIGAGIALGMTLSTVPAMAGAGLATAVAAFLTLFLLRVALTWLASWLTGYNEVITVGYDDPRLPDAEEYRKAIEESEQSLLAEESSGSEEASGSLADPSPPVHRV